MKGIGYKICLLFLFSLVCISLGNPILAEEPEEEDGWGEYGEEEDPWSSFDTIEDDLDIADDLDAITADPSSWYLGGYIKEDLAYGYARDTPNFAKILSTVNLALDVDLLGSWKAKVGLNGSYDFVYTYVGRDTFSSEILNAYETELELREAYVDGRLTDWLYLRLGRQIIAWGQSESSQITDVANPRDMRELGMVDLEDARVPVTATKLTGVLDDWELNLALIHEFRSHKLAAAGSEYDMLQSIRNSPVMTITSEETPDFKTEVVARALKRFNGGDISLILGDVYDDAPYLAFKQFVYTMSGATPVPVLTLTPTYKRIKTVGLSGTIVTGAWQFKTDIARKTGVAIPRKDLQDQITAVIAGGDATADTVYGAETNLIGTWKEKSVDQLMLGVEYSGFADLSLGLEGVIERIENFETTLADEEISGQLGVILSYAALNNTLTTRLFLASLTARNGAIFRINVDYDLMDALKLSGGLMLYETENQDSLLYNFRNNDRIFASVKYSF